MSTVLIILGRESGDFAKGRFNESLAETAREVLAEGHDVLFTDVEAGYDVQEEIAKFKAADVVVFQYPVYWFMMPATLKRYIDEVYAYGEFFAFTDAPYGQGGLMAGKRLMLSTTWNAPTEVFGNPGGFFEGANVDDVLLPMRKSHAYCGFEELPHFSAHDVIKNPAFERDRARYVEHLRAVFGLQPAA